MYIYIYMYQIISYYMYKHTVSYVLSYSYDRNDDLGKIQYGMHATDHGIWGSLVYHGVH